MQGIYVRCLDCHWELPARFISFEEWPVMMWELESYGPQLNLCRHGFLEPTGCIHQRFELRLCDGFLESSQGSEDRIAGRGVDDGLRDSADGRISGADQTNRDILDLSEHASRPKR